MAQGSRALTVLEELLSLVPKTYVAATTVYSYNSRGFEALFWPVFIA